jgi:GT2 family glycosyltransferase
MTAAASAQITASVVVVSVGCRDGLLDSLQLLRECNLLESSPGAATEVVVVEVGPVGDATVARTFPCVTLLQEAPDAGFARACNTGIAAARGARILLLDPCVRIPGRLLSDLLAHLDANPMAAAVGPELRRQQSLPPCAVAEPMPDPCAATAAWSTRAAEPVGAATDSDHESVEWLPATCLLLDRRALNDVGPFYEGLLFTFEEIDWCRRAREQGWEIHRLASASVDLAEQIQPARDDTSAADAVSYDDPFSRDRHRYFRAYHGRAAAMAVGAVSGAKRLVKSARAAIGLNR